MIAEPLQPLPSSARRLVRLDAVVDILDGRRVPVNSEERGTRQGSVPYYGATGQVGWIDDYLFEEELVLLGEDGAPFLDSSKHKAYIIEGKAWVNNHAHVLRAKQGVSNRFLLHQLNSVDYRHFVSGTTRLKLTQGMMRQIPLWIPTISVQHKIVERIEEQLSQLDAGVAALRRAQANLKRYRASILKAAVEGRLVPTEADLAGQEGRAYETGHELLSRVQYDRGRSVPTGKSTVFATIPSLPLPDGWAWATVDMVAAPTANAITDGPFGSNLKTEHYQESGPRVIRLQNISDGVFVDARAHISEAHFLRLLRHEVVAGDVLIAALGEEPPRACLAPPALGPAIVKADCIRLRPHPSVLRGYLNIALNAQPTKQRTKSIVHGVGRPRLNLSEIRSIAMPIPPLAEQERIVAEVERRLSVADAIEKILAENLKRATRLRQAILHAAFAGADG